MNRFRLCCAVLLLGAVSPASASDFDSASVKFKNYFASDIEATSSDVEIRESKFNYTHDTELFDALPFKVTLDINHFDINENDPVNLPSHLESRRFGVSVKFPAPFTEDERLFVGVDVSPMLNTDAWRWSSGAFRIPSRIYLIFKESENFILAGGVSIRPDYEELVLPLLALRYKPYDGLSFNLDSDNPNITWALSDELSVLWEFGYTFDEYEVTRGTQEGVVLRFRQLSTGLALKHKNLDETTQFSLNGGWVFNRLLEYRDDVGKVVPDNGVYAGLDLITYF